MIKINKSVVCEHDPKHLYSIISDIELYPEFLKWCDKVEVLETNEQYVIAKVHVRKGLLSTSFITKNQYFPDKKVTMELVKGPISSLNGMWEITSISPNVSKVDFSLDFSLKSSILGLTIKPLIKSISNDFVESFIKRVNQK